MTIFQKLFLVFLSVPILEIYLLLKIGGLIGVIPTIFMVVGTATLGAWMLRIQGFSTWQRLQSSLARGEMPAVEMVEGPLLLVGGALLLTPGFFTDAVGFLCLFPQSRRRIALSILNNQIITSADMKRRTRESSSSTTIEAEFKRDD